MFKVFGNKIVFLGVSPDDRAKISDFATKFGLTFSMAHDENKRIASFFDARVPAHILIDRQGVIRYHEPSPPETKDLEQILK